MIFLERRDIQTRTVFAGNILRHPGFKDIKKVVSPEGYPNADLVMSRGLLIGAHHGMTKEMINHVHDSFSEFAKQF
jgi:CDP-4-dehydro-6-deoxyglucose reductase, E1